MASRWSIDYSAVKPTILLPDPPCVPAKSRAVAKGHKAGPVAVRDADTIHRLRQRKAWDLALAPAKSVPMQGFMMYMSGSSIQIYSLFMLYMLFKNVFGGIFGVNKVFQPLEAPIHDDSKTSEPTQEQSFLSQKITYVICQILLCGVGLYKANSMGLLPTKEDFTSRWTDVSIDPFYLP